MTLFSLAFRTVGGCSSCSDVLSSCGSKLRVNNLNANRNVIASYSDVVEVFHSTFHPEQKRVFC